MEHQSSPTPHVLIFPLPLQGHVTPMLNLAELFCLANLKVTFLNTTHNHKRLTRYTNTEARFACYPGFRFKTVHDGLPDDHPRAGASNVKGWLKEMIQALASNGKSLLREILVGEKETEKVTCLVTDGWMSFANEVANEADVPVIAFRCPSACCNWTYFCIPKLIDAGEVPFKAEYLKLPYLDAYLNKEGNFSHGANFAVAGSTALSTDDLAAKKILAQATRSSLLPVQLAWFRSHLPSVCPNPSDWKNKLANALFIIETGGNDFNYAFFGGKTMQEVRSMVPQVIGGIRKAVEELISVGATKIVVTGQFPIGCMPIFLASFQSNDANMYDELKCHRGMNDFAMFQNDYMQQTIREIQREHPTVKIVYADYFTAVKLLLQNAASLGFDKDATQRACCGRGNNAYNFDPTNMCGSGFPVCENPNKSVSWDGVHMTEHAYKVMAMWLLKHNIVPSLS
ncbi:GDSL esterase/lipase At5g03980 isoform X2 [Spinacia oleracea]|uniref:GDSL esterase/lipase At5g03980 isoform X2 n=1 Tax=Spinacia oleracea TaxID=3562 RepID=A0ABM3QG54_SPIOL|nr:GDSL esterase/lipase At5g03980-like isoform X2 [Spinacia oleracea]